jgi:hypothetical protein
MKNIRTDLSNWTLRLMSSRCLMPLMTLMMLLQRSPVVKLFAEMTFSNPLRIVQSMPAVVATALTFGGTHAMSGATREVSPASPAFPNPLRVKAGDPINWAMTVELRVQEAESWQLMRFSGPSISALSTSILGRNIGQINGTLTQPGTYVMEVIAWEKRNNAGYRSDPFYLTIEVEAAASPFETKFPELVNDPSGWSQSPWFGWIFGGEFPVIRHVNHGEIYMVDNGSPDQHFYYDFGLRSWVYTATALYPYLYVYGAAEWYYYLLDTGNGATLPRWFKTFGAQGGWVSEFDLQGS